LQHFVEYVLAQRGAGGLLGSVASRFDRQPPAGLSMTIQSSACSDQTAGRQSEPENGADWELTPGSDGAFPGLRAPSGTTMTLTERSALANPSSKRFSTIRIDLVRTTDDWEFRRVEQKLVTACDGAPA